MSSELSPFPYQLRQEILAMQKDSSHDFSGVAHALDSPTIRAQLLKWQKNHPIMDGQPLLNRIFSYIERHPLDNRSPLIHCVNLCTGYFKQLTRNPIQYLLENWIEHPSNPPSLIQKTNLNNLISFISEYHATGLISNEQLVEMLKIHLNGAPLLFWKESLMLLRPTLEKLGELQLFEVLKIQDNNGYHIGFLEDDVKILIPLLNKLNANQLAEWLMMHDKNNISLIEDSGAILVLKPLIEKKLNQKQLLTLIKSATLIKNEDLNQSIPPVKPTRSITKITRMVAGLEFNAKAVRMQVKKSLPVEEHAQNEPIKRGFLATGLAKIKQIATSYLKSKKSERHSPPIKSASVASAALPELSRAYGLNNKQASELQARATQIKNVSEVAQVILNYKESGLTALESALTLHALLKEAVRSLDLTFDEKAILTAIDTELVEDYRQFAFLYKLTRTLTDFPALRDVVTSNYANEIFEKIEKNNNKPIGTMFVSGWRSKPYGHVIGIEIEKIHDSYVFTVANIGKGAKSTGSGQCQPVRTYRLPTSKKENLKIILELLGHLNFSYTNSKAPDEDFYLIFKQWGAKEIANPNLPSRPYQETGNCTIRSIEELIFNKLQRMGRHDLANKLQRHNLSLALKEAQGSYPALREIAAMKKFRPDLLPIPHNKND